jgi:lipopolysaccharide biosynthesis glycosyltransferase
MSVHQASLQLDPIHFVCAADRNFGPYAGITISSVLNANIGEDIYVHLFSDNIRENDLVNISRMVGRVGAQFRSYNIGEKLKDASNIPTQLHHYSRATYSRLFIADLLPSDVRRVIYLDCDIVCNSSLRELWNYGEGLVESGKVLSAVRDVWVDENREHKLSLGMPADSTYYNSGVLVINLDAWRNSNISKLLLDFVAKRKTQYADQDAINSVLWRETAELPRRWNVMISSPIPGDARAQVETAALIHYCGGFKPWHFGYRIWMGTGAAAFRQAKLASPWRWKLPNFHLARIKKKVKQSLT